MPVPLWESGDVIPTTKTVQDFTNGEVFNGWTIIPTPFSPGLRSVEFSIQDTVGQVTNPFTQQSQIQQWPGGDCWMATATLPPMTRSQAVQWIAFLMAMRGGANVSLIGDPTMKVPQGQPQGTPVVDGSNPANNVAMSSVLVTKGWTPNVFRHLLVGDHIQIGNRMHSLLNTVNSDAAGAATLKIYPSLREQPANGEQIVTHDAKGLFRLANNKRTWSVDETYLYGLSFQITEAK